MSAPDPRDFTFVLPSDDGGAEGAFATTSVAVRCPQLEELGLQLERDDGFSLRSPARSGLALDPDGEWRERIKLSPERPVYDRSGFSFSVTAEGVLIGRAAAPIRDRSTGGPRLDDPELLLPDAARAAAQQAITLGQGEVAVGLVLRHGRPASVQVLIDGRDPVAACLHGWWGELDERARSDVSTRTLRAAVMLAQTAADLSAEDEAEDAGWLDDVAALCRSRDDLHSAARVLQRMSPDDVPREALASADRALRALLRSLYLPVPHTDPVIALAAAQTACWWSRPTHEAAPDEDAP